MEYYVIYGNKHLAVESNNNSNELIRVLNNIIKGVIRFGSTA